MSCCWAWRTINGSEPRLPRYYYRLRSEYELPVLPIVIYLNVHLDGIGEDVYRERFWEFEVSTFRYLHVGLAGLNAVEYLEGENWLGVALTALMRIPLLSRQPGLPILWISLALAYMVARSALDRTR